MRTHQPNPKKFKRGGSFMLPCRLRKMLGSEKMAVVVTTKPGEVIRALDGRRYQVQRSGAIRRLEPRPWRGKAERKAVLRERRRQRDRQRLLTSSPTESKV